MTKPGFEIQDSKDPTTKQFSRSKSVGSHYKLSGQDPGSAGSLKKIPVQYATSIKILHIRPCILPYYRKTYRKLRSPKIHTVHQKRYLMIENPPEPIHFIGAKSRIPCLQQHFFSNKIQDPGSWGSWIPDLPGILAHVCLSLSQYAQVTMVRCPTLSTQLSVALSLSSQRSVVCHCPHNCQ